MYPWLPWCRPGYTFEEAHGWVEHAQIAFAEGEKFDFVIESGEGRFLGGCGLNQLNAFNRFANLGYWVRRTATGKGAATAAARLVRDWAFANTELERLEIVVAMGNEASMRVAEKSGAVREAVLRNRIYLHGKPHDAVMFAFIR